MFKSHNLTPMSQRFQLGLLKDIPEVEASKIYTLYFSPSQLAEYRRQIRLGLPRRRITLVKYELPSSFSWMAKMPSIRDQKDKGACAAFAATACNDFINRNVTEEGNITNLSEAWLYEISNNLCTCPTCGTYYAQDVYEEGEEPKKCEDIICPKCGNPTTRICNCGRCFYMVIKQLGGKVFVVDGGKTKPVLGPGEFGEPIEACWPYANACTGEPPETYGAENPNWCSDWKEESEKQKIEYETPDITVNNLKHVIYMAPICIGMEVYENFFSYSGGIYDKEEGGYAGGHGVSFIGWDDTERYFWLRNSWGESWGINGYCKYSYDLIGSLFDAYLLKRHTTNKCDTLWVEEEI